MRYSFVVYRNNSASPPSVDILLDWAQRRDRGVLLIFAMLLVITWKTSAFKKDFVKINKCSNKTDRMIVSGQALSRCGHGNSWLLLRQAYQQTHWQPECEWTECEQAHDERGQVCVNVLGVFAIVMHSTFDFTNYLCDTKRRLANGWLKLYLIRIMQYARHM